MGRLVLFSEVSGVVSREGEPVAGVDVERRWHWVLKDELGSDRTRTDESGSFRFPAVTRRSLLARLMPHEPVVGQKIVIHEGGEERVAWQFTRHDYRDGSELPGRPLELTCPLEREPVRRGPRFGIAIHDMDLPDEEGE
jgi:hypothetical protein